MGPKHLAVFCGCKSIIMRLYLQNFGHYYAVLIRRGVAGRHKNGTLWNDFFVKSSVRPIGGRIMPPDGRCEHKIRIWVAILIQTQAVTAFTIILFTFISTGKTVARRRRKSRLHLK